MSAATCCSASAVIILALHHDRLADVMAALHAAKHSFTYDFTLSSRNTICRARHGHSLTDEGILHDVLIKIFIYYLFFALSVSPISIESRGSLIRFN